MTLRSIGSPSLNRRSREIGQCSGRLPPSAPFLASECFRKYLIILFHLRFSNPAKTCIVFMFLLSKSGNSVGVWRRRIAVPEKLQNDYRNQIRNIESGLRDKVYTVKLE